MQDEQIIALYYARDERAIAISSDKYGVYCTSIAQNILQNLQDSEECVNDTWLSAWNSMPPAKPAVLKTYLGKITRNLAIDRWRRKHTEKRGA
ncbi:MAG: RNA polymerase subunit sigma-70, partial [Clostridia bacterium]|nr:RNA polymerase subunit sigma-70 [Clostridia bacterium]